MAEIANIAKIPVPSKEKGQRSIPISEAFFARIIPSWSQPSELTPDQWRTWVKMQPIAVTCKETMTSNVSDLDWKITPRESDQRDELKGTIKHYEKLLQRGGYSGLDWVGLLEWALADLLDLPFGSAWEVGRKGDSPEGRVMWLEPIDGGTCYPTNNKDFPVFQYYNGYQATFPKHAIARMYLNPRTEIERRGWGMAPPERIFLAMEMLARGDRYYANLLLDIPPAGVFDLGDITWEDAHAWIQSFRSAVTGVGSADSFKIPVLAEHTGEVKFIPLGKAPNDIMYDRITLKYASLVTAGYGMNLGDIGVQSASSSGETLAGSIRGEQKTNRTGKARVKAKIKYFIESFLPSTLQFDFIDTDGERLSMLGRARLANATAFNQLREMESISPEEARLQMIQDGLMTISMPEKPPKEAKKPVEPMLGLGKKAPERPGQIGAKQPPSMGGDGEVKKSVEFVSYPSDMDRVVEKVVGVLAPSIQESFVDAGDDDYEPMKSLLLDTLFTGETEESLSSALEIMVKSMRVGDFQIDRSRLESELRDIFASEGIHVLNVDNYIDGFREKCQSEFPAFFGKAIVYTLINSELFSEDLLPNVQKRMNDSLHEIISSFVNAELESLLNSVRNETPETPSFITPKSVVRQKQAPITVEGPQITMPPINVTVPQSIVETRSGGSTGSDEMIININSPENVDISSKETLNALTELASRIEGVTQAVVEKNTPAPVVNVHVPKQDAPVVNVSTSEPVVNVSVPAPVAPQVNVQVNPTPVEVNNQIEVKPADVVIPKPKRETQVVYRDVNFNIEGTVTDIEYEE